MRKRHQYLVLVMVGLVHWLVLLPGCSEDDDPVCPVVGETGAASLDELMTLFTAAFNQMDIGALDRLLDGDFRFDFTALDMFRLGLYSDHLNRPEFLATLQQIFSGEPFEGPDGTVAGVSAIFMPPPEPDGEWVVQGGAYPETRRRSFGIRIEFSRPGDVTILIQGPIEVLAISRRVMVDGELTARWFLSVLADQTDLGGGKGAAVEQVTLGSTLYLYFANLPPVAQLTLSPAELLLQLQYLLDASESWDPDGGLNQYPYRWRFDDEDTWTRWSDSPYFTHQFLTPGNHAVWLEVRDRWAASDTAVVPLDIPVPAYPFPSTEDQIVANFYSAYTGRLLDWYENVLHPDYRWSYQEWDIQNGDGEVPAYHLRDRELDIAGNMFTGEDVVRPDGTVPGISGISIYQLVPVTQWELETAGDFAGTFRRVYDVEIRFYRPQSTTLWVTGPTEFFVTSRDSLHEGSIQPFWQLAGQIDHTSSGKATESATWGTVKHLYRSE